MQSAPNIARLMDGYLITQLLCVAARLSIADAMAEAPQTAEALAQRTGTNADVLRRMLRVLTTEGVVDELADGRFGLAPSGHCLRADAPGSLRASIIARGDLYYHAAAGLFAAVQTGCVPFEHMHGSRFFDYLAQRSESRHIFHASQEARARNEAAAVVAAYDFARFERLVDVGGGHGVMLDAILRAAPGLRATLVDLPPVVEHARALLGAAGHASRCDFVAGDFFVSVPAGAAAYLLSRIIHDWDDAAALTILRCCRKAVPPGGTLVLVEVVLPQSAAEAPEAIRMDLHMLTLLGGRERGGAEFDRLLAAAGFRIKRILPTHSAACISVIEAE